MNGREVLPDFRIYFKKAMFRRVEFLFPFKTQKIILGDDYAFKWCCTIQSAQLKLRFVFRSRKVSRHEITARFNIPLKLCGPTVLKNVREIQFHSWPLQRLTLIFAPSQL